MAIIDIIDLMAPGTINYEFVKTGSGLSDEVSCDLDDDDDDDDIDDDDVRVYLKAVSCEFQNLQIIRTTCKCEVMMC